MKSLKEIFSSLIKEEEQKVVEFPSKNMTLALNKPEKKITLSPLNPKSSSSSIRSLINQLKQKGFKILKVVPLEMNSFEVQLDASENFDIFVDYIKSQFDQQKL